MVCVCGYQDEDPVLGLAQRWLDSHNAYDVDALATVLDAKVEVHSLFRDAPARGRAEAISHFDSTMGAFPDLHIEVVASAVTEPGSAYAAAVEFVGHFTGRLRAHGLSHPGTGRAFKVPGVVLLAVRDGAVITVRTLFDKTEWLAQIGLLATPLSTNGSPDITPEGVQMKTVNYAGLNHMALVTDDMEKTVRFYRDVLGMPLVGTTGNRDENYPHRHYFLSIGKGASIAFFEWQDAELPPRKDSGVPASGLQFDHVAIGVDSEDDLQELGDRLRAQGYDASEIVDHGLVHSLYCTDPNGISIEFCVSMRDLDVEPYFDDADPVPAALETVSG